MKDNVTAILYSCLFEDFPDLRIGIAEYEISWAPYLLNRMDRIYEERPQRFSRRYKDGGLPSDYFKSNMFLSFQEDDLGIQLREYVGVDTLQVGFGLPPRRVHLPQVPRNRRPHPGRRT